MTENMNSKALEGIKNEESLEAEYKDTRLHIKDLEAEREHFLLREPNEVETIARIEKHIDELYERLDDIILILEYNETNEISKS
tara:strand:+ start:332 stop:583 length:252 start_codon:yes stop_codon:yes gene_type:complete